MANAAQPRTAVLYRMVMAEHVCPWGLKALHLLKSRGFRVDDRHLTTRAETDAFKAEHGVKTTPQVFIEGQRIGGHDDLRRYLGLKVKDPSATSYTPVLVVFAATALMALAASQATLGSPFTVGAAEWFIGFSMVVLAMLKLQDIDKFSAMFLNYDLLARRWVPYGTIYPFAEAAAGVLMIAGVLPWLSIPIALFIGTIGAVSVFKAVYVDKRTLKCACVGGSSSVPLGFLSLTENLMMIAMAGWMALTMAGVGLPVMSHHDGHAGHEDASAQEAASTTAFRAANDRMHGQMTIAFTGDADTDFLRGMIPHHEGAIAMAEVVRQHGRDPAVRELAEQNIAAQRREIVEMRGWLSKREVGGKSGQNAPRP